MAECQTASALRNLLTDQLSSEQLRAVGSFNSVDDLKDLLRNLGIDLDSCDPMQTLKVIRESLSSLTDDDLVEAQGGEVKFVALAVGVGAAAAVAGGIAVGGVAAGGVLLSKTI